MSANQPTLIKIVRTCNRHPYFNIAHTKTPLFYYISHCSGMRKGSFTKKKYIEQNLFEIFFYWEKIDKIMMTWQLMMKGILWKYFILALKKNLWQLCIKFNWFISQFSSLFVTTMNLLWEFYWVVLLDFSPFLSNFDINFLFFKNKIKKICH